MKTLCIASLLAASALFLTGTAEAAGNGRSSGPSGHKSSNHNHHSSYGYRYGYGSYGYPQYTYAPFCGPVLECPPVCDAPVCFPATTYYTPDYGYGYGYNSRYQTTHKSYQNMHSRPGGRR
jgi:hypothetical protein